MKLAASILVLICVSYGATAQNTDYLDLDTPDFKLRLVKTSQTVAALEPKSTPGFDFTPADRLSQRAADGYHHLGDLIVRVRAGSSGPWRNYDTAGSRKPVQALTVVDPTLAAADLSPTLPHDIPLQITRSWLVDNGRLVLRFKLTNKTDQSVQIGALGIPVVFNNMRGKPRPLPIRIDVEPGEEAELRLEMRMHRGMDGLHRFRLPVLVEGEPQPLELYVRALFR